MSFSILIVMHDPLFRETIKTSIHDLFDAEGHETLINMAGNVAEARLKIKKAGEAGYDLLICHVHIPEDSKSPVNTAKRRGLLLLQELKKEGIEAPGILIALDASIYTEVQHLERVGLVLDGTETMNEDLGVLCRKFLIEESPQGGEQTQAAPRKFGKVDLILNPNKGNSIYIMEGIGFRFNPIPEPLQIDPEEIEDLINRSRNVGELTEWKTELLTIGKKILKELFEKNRGFNDNFRDLVREVGGEENIRIRFVVEENIYPLALEALVDESGEYFMLLSPLFRTVMVNHLSRQKEDILFVDNVTDRPPINCLIIAADTWGKVNDPRINGGEEITLARLPKVMDEAKNLYDYLDTNQKEFNIANVKIVTAKPDSDFYSDLKGCLADDNTWHLIHYAGHSYFDSASKTGYFFYPGKTKPIPLESDVFSYTLRYKNKTQFIYLSSCQSSGADFVLGLARQQIPGIVGFRWKIDDKDASEYARLFYENLFAENKSLPYAFLEIRREMYERNSDNRIWAAAMLIIQGG